MVKTETMFVTKRERQESDVTSSTTYDASTNDVKSGITLNQLDVYCLAHIFSFLSLQDKFSMQLVSKKCKWAMDNTWYFKVFESNKEPVNRQGRLSDDSHESYFIPRCAKYLRKYKKQLDFPITTKHFEVLQRDCRNLTYLEFSVYYQHKHYFFNAFTNMQKLKTIKIRLVKAKGGNDDDITDTRILESVTRNVEEITLIGFDPQIRLGKHFLRILEEFKSLTSLGIEIWTLDSSITKVISQMTKLRHLSLSLCTFNLEDLILKNLTSLESFDVSGCQRQHGKTHHLLKNIATDLQQLKSLNIGLLHVCDETLLAITQFKNLTELVVFCIEIHHDILSQFKNLIKFNCAYTVQITDASVKRFIENNKDLELLNVSKTKITSETIYHLYDLTKTRKHHAPVLRLLVDEKLFKETQDSLKLKGNNPYFIVEDDLIDRPSGIIPEPKYLHCGGQLTQYSVPANDQLYMDILEKPLTFNDLEPRQQNLIKIELLKYELERIAQNNSQVEYNALQI